MGIPTAIALAPETALPTMTATPEAAPKFGEPGFRKGANNPRKGTPRARVTAIDLTYLLFLATFTGASAEALSMIREGDETNLGTATGGLPTIKATENRMRKLKKLGAVFSVRHAGTGVTSYSLTADGFGYLRSAGFEIDHGDTLRDTSLERLNHYEKIAHVAAMFASPAGLFEDSLGIGPVPLWGLVSEKAMRQSSAPIKAELKQLREAGQSGDFGPRREVEVQKLITAFKQGKPWESAVRECPAVLTLGLAETAGRKFRGVYEPDLAVVPDAKRTGTRAHNLLVEVELSRKSETAYHAILTTIDAETKRQEVYSRAVYMVTSEAVANRLIKVDREGKFGLIASGRLAIVYITHRDGTPVQVTKRITYGDN
jgi:hypothetical protein